MKKAKKTFDFAPIGKAIKNARRSKGMTREQLCNIIDIDPRYLAHIENDGRCPSLGLFYRIVEYLDISVDYFFLQQNKNTECTPEQQALIYDIMQLDNETVQMFQGILNTILEYKQKKLKDKDNSD